MPTAVPVDFTPVVFIRYEVVTPEGKRVKHRGEIDRKSFKREQVERLLLAKYPRGSRVENLRATDADGKVLAEQPEQFQEEQAAPVIMTTAPVAKPQ